MKLYRTILISFCILTIYSMSGCKKKETTTTTPAPVVYTSSISYMKDGVPQTVDSISAFSSNTSGINYLLIDAYTKSPSQEMKLWIIQNTSTGNFALNSIGDNYSLQFINTAPFYIQHTSSNGSITITKHDTGSRIIEGNFTAKTYDNPSSPTDSVNITDGLFKIKY